MNLRTRAKYATGAVLTVAVLALSGCASSAAAHVNDAAAVSAPSAAASASPSPQPIAATVKPTVKLSPKPTAKATAKPKPQPTTKVTAKPKPKPTPEPTTKAVHAGAFCSGHGAIGYTSAGKRERCSTKAGDINKKTGELYWRWRAA